MSKFVINRGIDNEFVLTIKQNGTTLPMEIVTDGDSIDTVDTVRNSISYTYVPEVPEVPAIEAVAAVAYDPGQEFIASVTGTVEKYRLVCGTLSNNVYKIYINSTTYSLEYNSTIYDDKYDFLIAMRNLINAGITNNVCTAYVDSNILYIDGVTEGVSYTVNSSSVFTIAQIQKAITPVIGQPYIAPTEAVEEVVGVPAVPAVDAYYNIDEQILVVTLPTINVYQQSIQSVKVRQTSNYTITSLTEDSVEVTPVNGFYTIAGDTFSVTIGADTVAVDNTPEDLVFEVTTTYVGFDTFTAKLLNMSDSTVVATIPVTVYSAKNGKVKLTIDSALTNTLSWEKGAKADYYYTKPMYKLLIDCSTVNNGDFTATIEKVYVE